MMHRLPLALLAVLLVVLGACASDDAEQLAALSQPCSLSSECSNGLACVFGRCHTPCRSSVDCTPAATDAKVARCLRADPNVCVLASETTCVVDGDCAPGTVCGVDRQCRSGCGNDGDCLAGQQCSYRTCADDGELGPDGELVVLDETGLIGTACTRNSECTPKLRCIGGLCDRECRTNVDCAAGLSCSPTGLCVTGTEPPPNGCLPLTCESAGANCGQLLDGCGGVLQCDGTGVGDHGCPNNEFCGSDGRPNVCGIHACMPTDVCAGKECGQLSDGCATVESCGSCRAEETCDDTQQCVCTPNPNACQGNACGPKGDGCGNTIDCGGCQAEDTCGGAGVPGTCGCLPKTCATAAGGQPACGKVLDGCGGVLDCSQPPYACSGPKPNCGGDGVPNQCSFNACNGDDPNFCSNRGWTCGTYSNGCDGVVTCGSCNAPETCGGGGTPKQCGCTPVITDANKDTKCAELGKDCGSVADGCGGTVDCGTCSVGTCGSGGVPNVCSCKPKTCGEQGLVCGVASDGCGGRIVCGGQCAAGTYCGAVEPNKCAATPAPGTSCPSGAAGCEVVTLPAGNFDRVPTWYNPICRLNQDPVLSAPAHVSGFRLDVEPVSAARYGAYLDNGGYFAGSPPPLFAGRHRNISATLVETGWQSSWDTYLPIDRADFEASNPDFATLPNGQPVALEWAQAFAFCIWDGGRLPTENEYLYAAYGGEGVARDFPWREVVPSTPGTCPSSATPAANDDFGLQELGLRGEWTYDVVAVGATATTFDPASCAALDCVAFGSSTNRRVYGSPNSNNPFSSPTFVERGSAAATVDVSAARSAFRCAREVP